MDINCLHACYYQSDGKCTLNELPSFTQTTYSSYDVDCPYYYESGSR